MSKKKKQKKREADILFKQMLGSCVIFTMFVITLVCFIVVVRG